jgi:hypothetical protein
MKALPSTRGAAFVAIFTGLAMFLSTLFGFSILAGSLGQDIFLDFIPLFLMFFVCGPFALFSFTLIISGMAGLSKIRGYGGNLGVSVVYLSAVFSALLYLLFRVIVDNNVVKLATDLKSVEFPILLFSGLFGVKVLVAMFWIDSAKKFRLTK